MRCSVRFRSLGFFRYPKSAKKDWLTRAFNSVLNVVETLANSFAVGFVFCGVIVVLLLFCWDQIYFFD